MICLYSAGDFSITIYYTKVYGNMDVIHKWILVFNGQIVDDVAYMAES